MNRTLTLLTALGAGLTLAPLVSAQTPAAPAAPTAPAPVAPQAVPAKIALINFEQVVLASNEGQTVTAKTQKKFDPQRTEIEKEAAEVDKLKKALEAAPATLPDAERASQLRAIDVKEKKLNSDAEAASTEYNNEWQEGLRGVAEKLAGTMKKYAADNGFTLLLDVSSQSSNVLWAVPQTDISQAVVELYNKTSGVPAPPPPAPRAGAARPASRPAPAAAKPPVK
jgi:Skp family chaperone for outer membrane proteins